MIWKPTSRPTQCLRWRDSALERYRRLNAGRCLMHLARECGIDGVNDRIAWTSGRAAPLPWSLYAAKPTRPSRAPLPGLAKSARPGLDPVAADIPQAWA